MASRDIHHGVLKLRFERRNSTCILKLRGALDLSTSQGLRVELERLEEADCERIVLDLRQLVFMDVAGLRVITSVASQSRQASVSLVRGPAIVQRVFELTGADEEVTFLDDE